MPTVRPTNTMNPMTSITNFPSTMQSDVTMSTVMTTPPSLMRHVDQKDDDDDIKADDGLTAALTKLQSSEKEKDNLDITPEMASKILKLIKKKGDRLEQKHREAASMSEFGKPGKMNNNNFLSEVSGKAGANSFTVQTEPNTKDERPRLPPSLAKKETSYETKATSIHKVKDLRRPAPTEEYVEYPRPKLLSVRRPYLHPTRSTMRSDERVGWTHTVAAPILQRDEARVSMVGREEDVPVVHPTLAVPNAVHVFMPPYQRENGVQRQNTQSAVMPAPPPSPTVSIFIG